MGSQRKILQRRSTCHGDTVVVGVPVGAPPAGAEGDPALALATLLAEEERATGRTVAAVVLRCAAPEDAAWEIEAARWVASHGRRAAVRTCAVLPRGAAETLRAVGAQVLLELASREDAVQRALVGPGASGVAALLLQAQHLQAVGTPVAAWVGPLVGGVHDAGELGPLLSHAAAASLRAAHLTVGRMSAHRFSALGRVLPRAELSAVARAYGFDPVRGPGPVPARLPTAAQVGLHAKAAELAAGLGIATDPCGCPLATCSRIRGEVHPAPLGGVDLFEGTG